MVEALLEVPLELAVQLLSASSQGPGGWERQQVAGSGAYSYQCCGWACQQCAEYPLTEIWLLLLWCQFCCEVMWGSLKKDDQNAGRLEL